jgi:membrane-associated phospholipid phosphatase
MVSHNRSLIVTLLLAVGVSTHAAAQTRSPQDSAKRAGKPLFTTDDAWLGLAFTGITIAMFPTDKAAARRLREPSSSENSFIKNSTKGVELLADPGSIIIGSAAYVVGKVTHHKDLADAGFHGTESIIFASGITMVLKDVLGRSRPFVSNGTDPRDWKFGGGFKSGDRQSFPSGHTTAAFAAAASVTSEVKRMYPQYAWVAGPIMYTGATMVGLSRMYHNKHWASDVALGAAVGTFSGLKVVRYSHNHPGNRIDRRFLGVVVGPNGEGGALTGLSLAW